MAKADTSRADDLRVQANRLSLRLSRPLEGGQPEAYRLEAELDALKARIVALETAPAGVVTTQ